MKTKQIVPILNIFLVACMMFMVNSCKKEKTIKEEIEEVKNVVINWNRLNNTFSKQGLDSLLNDELYFYGSTINKSEYLPMIKERKFYDQSDYELFDTIHVEQEGTPNGVVYRCHLIRKYFQDGYTTFVPMILDFSKNEEGNWKLVSETHIDALKNIALEKEKEYIQNNLTNEHKDIIDFSTDGYVFLYKFTEEFSDKNNNTIYQLGRGGTLKKFMAWNNGIGSLIEKNNEYPFDGLGEFVTAVLSLDNKVFMECKAWESSNAIFCAYDDKIYFISKGSLLKALSNNLVLIITNEIGKDNKIQSFRKVIDYKGNVIFSELDTPF